MIALVTGGSGFIGQNLVRRLHTQGHEVRCLVRRRIGELPEGVHQFVVDLGDTRSVRTTPALDGADAVFHLAGATKGLDDAAFVSANVTPTRTLLGAITARRDFPRFVYVSSQAAAGPAADVRHPVDEEDPPQPVEAYGRSKLLAERVVDGFADRVPVTIVRPCSVYGAFDRDFLALFRLARLGVVLYPGVRDHWLSILHVDDVVAGLLLAATGERAIGRTYFLSSAAAVQWRDLGDAVASVCGRPVRHVDVPAPAVHLTAWAGQMIGRLTGHATLANRNKALLLRPRYWVCSANRARDELGFVPSRSLPDGVQETYNWYRTRGWLPESPRAVATRA